MSKQQNQVRPRMSRENYEWLQSIEGDTNDERVENLKADAELLNALSIQYKKLALENRTNKRSIKTLNQCLDITGEEKIRMKSERDSFIVYLGLSMAINFGLLGYIATLQGWF